MNKDYIEALLADLPHMFKGKPNIEAFDRVVGKQLNDVLQFYEQLNLKRSLDTAEGIQLDAIGDILGMTRKQAYDATDHTDPHALSDEDYRTLLAYKIMLNYGHATYYDIMRGIRRFYKMFPVKYHEELDSPAAFSVEVQCEPDQKIVLRNLLPIKAAGVNCSYQFRLYARIEVGSSVELIPYDVPECGTLLCGTYPITATKGNSQSGDVHVSIDTGNINYIPRFTGTIPDIATKGRTDEMDVNASSEIKPGVYVSDESGNIITGTKPGVSTVGNSSEHGNVNASSEVSSAEYETRITGEYPDTASKGYVTQGAEAEASVAANAYKVVVNVCGVKECGE